jgi:hypothetical protein
VLDQQPTNTQITKLLAPAMWPRSWNGTASERQQISELDCNQMPALDSFDDVRGLTDPELCALLERGQPEQRVWALWALALRSADSGGSIEAITRRDEPSPGVRRNVAVVLAGHGHYDLLVALARRDPAPDVRASAMQLVARIALDGKLPVSIVTERIAADGAPVKIAVLGTASEGAASWLVEIAQALLEDGDPEVRYEAFEALVRAGTLPHALMWLEEAPESEARLALMRWTARVRVQPVATALAGASRRMRRLLVETVRVATWHELAPALGEDSMLVRTLVGRSPQVVDHMPLAALVRASLGDAGRWLNTIARRLDALASPDPALDELLPQLIDLCTHRIVAIDSAVATLPDDGDMYDEIDRQELSDERVVYERCIAAAARLIVH